MHHALTATTLPLGEALASPSVRRDYDTATECDKPLCEYVFGSGGGTACTTSDDVLVGRLGKWIETKGPKVPSDQAPGQVETVSKIWGMMLSQDVLQEDLAKLETDLNKLGDQVKKAKAIQLAKFSGPTGIPDPKKLAHLENWEKQKLEGLAKKVAEKEAMISELGKSVHGALKQMLSDLKTPSDPLCEQFLTELDDMFERLDLGDGRTGVPMDADLAAGDPGLNANTVALHHVQSLEDGPQKTALMAVLEAATVNQQA